MAVEAFDVAKHFDHGECIAQVFFGVAHEAGASTEVVNGES